MNDFEHRLAENHQRVLDRIAQACRRAGRPSGSVRLIAVTKYARMEWVRALVSLGARDLGESRPQQLVERAAEVGHPVDWHLIGPLQRNKARRILPLVAWIHSVDSWRLLHWLDALAAELHLRPRVLIEVNVSGETAKHGFAPDRLTAEWDQALAARHVDVRGLMTMAPYDASESIQRQVFTGLRTLRDTLASRSPSLPLPELSMGMSDDFERAIEDGSTMVRIGSALFEGLADDDRA